MDIFVFHGWHDTCALHALSKIYARMNMEYNEDNIILEFEDPNKTVLNKLYEETGVSYFWENYGNAMEPMFVLVMESILLREFGNPQDMSRDIWNIDNSQQKLYEEMPDPSTHMITDVKNNWFL